LKILPILSKKSPAFSLLELLVAVSVLSILLVILLNIVQGATSLWRTSENKVEAYREARAALQVMSSDLKNILPSTNFAFFRTNISGYPSATNLAFLATLPISSQNIDSLSDVCTVGYFLAYNNKSPIAGATGRQSYNLYRYFVESNETFEKLSDASGPTAVLDFDSDFPAEILARNVVGFNATYLVTNGTGAFTIWTQSSTTPMPHVVEIQITAVNNERTMRFGARSASGEWDTFSTNTNAPDYLKNSKTFTTRIPLNTP
jgi:prepilin-type N-terminal cleavage/methylation domain-containing protein